MEVGEKILEYEVVLKEKDGELNIGFISEPEDIAKAMRQLVGDSDRENIYVFHLNIKGKVIGYEFLAMGALDSCLTSIPNILKSAVLSNAHRIILSHNHISNNSAPSNADMMLTKQLNEACNIFGIQLLDHVIVPRGDYKLYSFAESGLLNKF